MGEWKVMKPAQNPKEMVFQQCSYLTSSLPKEKQQIYNLQVLTLTSYVSLLILIVQYRVKV